MPVLEGEAPAPEAPPPQRSAPQAPLPRGAEPGIGYPEGAGREDYSEPPLDLRPQARPAPRGYDRGYDMPPGPGEGMAPPAHEAPPSMAPEEMPRPRLSSPTPSAGTGAGALPQDLWRGLDPGALRALIEKAPLPSPSPTLAGLTARALVTGAAHDEAEREARAAGLRRAGRMAELAELAGISMKQLDRVGKRRGGSAAKASAEDLYFLARDASLPPEERLAAAERAAALNILEGDKLAEIYRKAVPKLPDSADGASALRAKLFVALGAQDSPKLRAEAIDALLASARDAGIESAIAAALSEESVDLAGDAKASNFAETGVRIAALAGEREAAWAWVENGGDAVQSWQLLLGALDPSGGRNRAALEAGVEIATRSHLPGPVLQRLVTVLDALGEDVPIPLWDYAGRSPPPEGGYLPETGLLSGLKDAAERGEVGRTILLVAAALGPDGAPGAHLIALGDSLRALRRVGLDAEARGLALEALAAHWPAAGRR